MSGDSYDNSVRTRTHLLVPVHDTSGRVCVASGVVGPIGVAKAYPSKWEQYVRVTTYLGTTLLEGMSSVLEHSKTSLWPTEEWLRLYHYIVKKANLLTTSNFVNVVALDTLIRGPDDFANNQEMSKTIRDCRDRKRH